jgi:hypothetical protein
LKKIVILASLLASSIVFAADFVTVDYDNVKGRHGATDSMATTVRAGKEISGIQYGLQSRTARFEGGGLSNSLEVTAGKNFGGFLPYVGVGHDFGYNGGATQNYGLVGGQYGLGVGPGFALVGIKTRIRTNDTDTRQTVTYATYSIPVAKSVVANLNASYSSQDIKEKSVGVGLGFMF